MSDERDIRRQLCVAVNKSSRLAEVADTIDSLDEVIATEREVVRLAERLVAIHERQRDRLLLTPNQFGVVPGLLRTHGRF